jgi:D-3-phosphoglycerate dehydrogenase
MYKESDKISCLIVDDIHPTFMQQAITLGFDCIQDIYISRENLENEIEKYQILVINSKVKVDKVLLDKAKKLQYILRPGSGLENVDLNYAAQKNIICINSPEGNCNAVAEHTICVLLMWHHQILKPIDEVKNKIWLRKENTWNELGGKTIGIIGYGNVGMAVVEKLQNFDVNILVYDKYKSGFGSEKIKESSLQNIMEHADIISLHVPLTDETKNLIDDNFVANCKKNFLLINTARGGIVATQSVVNGLKTKKLLGACLDVLQNESLNIYTEQENLNLEYLLNASNVLITPHIGGWTQEAKFKMADILIKKIKKNFIIN